MIFPGGIKGTMQHKLAHQKAKHKAMYFADNANKHFDVRDTFKDPTL